MKEKTPKAILWHVKATVIGLFPETDSESEKEYSSSADEDDERKKRQFCTKASKPKYTVTRTNRTQVIYINH